MDTIFYFRHLNSIGGIEAFFFYLAKKYSDRDITVYYSTADLAQVERLSKLIRTKKYRGEKIKCRKAVFCFNLDIIDNVEADEYIQTIHGDYKAMGIRPNTHPKITRYIGVSENACRTFTEITGFPCELSYNPIALDKPRKVLNLLTASRLTKEKGANRMRKLYALLEEAQIPFTWTVFTDAPPMPGDNFIFRRPRLDILDYIADADYLVQLSDNEGYCYSAAEALSVGTPIIATRLPVYAELGIEDGKHGYLLNLDMTDVPIKKIAKGVKPFKWEAPVDRWGEILGESESTYLTQDVRIRITGDYYDLLLHRNIEKGSELLVTAGRAEQIIDAGLAEYV